MNTTTVNTKWKLSINLTHCCHQADPTTNFFKFIYSFMTNKLPKKIKLLKTINSLYDNVGICACAKVCMNVLKFAKMFNYEGDK